MNLIDTHCHVHDVEDFNLSADEIVQNARNAGVGRMIVVGTDVENSRRAVEFAEKYDDVYAVIGIHPGVSSGGTVSELEHIIADCLHQGPTLTQKLVGLGDIGLDYHYLLQSSTLQQEKDRQRELLMAQLELAMKYNLPVSFHVREAFDDFWPIFDQFPNLQGALHCYTDNLGNMEKALERGLYISINGILTFNRESELDKVFEQIPLDRVLFETDAPYLAPIPYRGKQNQPAYVVDIANDFAVKRGMLPEEISEITTNNTKILYNI
ncbi:DNAse [Alphaproteobacteria bacterium]|nr:DNAse [Alphaproteobacteria bacterium]